MTFEEAKKILEKEGFIVEKVTRPHAFIELFIEYENPTICEAMQVVNSVGYGINMEMGRFLDRKARLKKELEEYSNAPMPGPGEEHPEDPVSDKFKCEAKLIGPLRRLNTETLGEQAKKIKRLGKEIARLNKIIHKKNLKIEELLKESSRHLEGKMKMVGENFDLKQELKDKNAVLSDVAEELRLTKIREKNLAELGLKYVGENEKLKKELADKVVGKIDAQALKSAERALAYKEKKIADLGNELEATKKELEEKTKLVEVVRKGSKEYCDYGIAAEKMIQKMAKVIVEERAIDSEDFEQYRRWANGYRFNPQLPEFSEEELMKIQEKVVASCDIAEEGDDHSGKIVLCGKDFVKILKENEKAAEELSKVLDDVIDQILLFGEIIIKEEK